ncbi:HYR domain-containing protein [Cognataquiflexum aquatile]|uniref:HYR domain-containing protein n=1 Tax=Cognataquiflexum aquatile TaxID=2249427 RepID=UPI000DEBFCD2|nr:HYR domain-containing protein [Cognataquiflexum aquatile]
MKKNYSDFCLIRTFRNIPFWIGIFLITFFSIGSVGAQDLYFYSGGGKIPLIEDRSSTIIQFNENANVQRTMAGMRSSQSLEKIEVQPNKKRAILKFDASQNVTSRQLNTNYFSNTGEIESSAFAFQVEGGMQLWPTNKVLLKLKPGKSISDLQQLMKQYRAAYLKTDHEMVILKVADMQNTLTLSNLIYESGLAAWSHPDFYAEIEHTDEKDLDKKANGSSDNPLFGIEGNPLFRETFVADTYFSDQFQMHNTGQLINGVPGLNDADSNALEAWGITTGSADIIVAVVDTGVEEHEDLGNVINGFTPARPLENGRPGNNPAGLNEHGQACAGIVAASHNGIGVMGVAPNVKIQPINIFTREEDASDYAAAYTWAADNGAHIISSSWGYNGQPCNFKIDAIDAAIEYAVTTGRGGKGSILVFCSMNEGRSDCAAYPSRNPNVIAVGAFGNNGVIAAYSNKGTALDLAAPSSGNGNARVTTIDLTGTPGYNNGLNPNNYPNDKYTNSFSGTSAACPVVSGVAALVLSVNPDLTDAEVKNILYSSAIDMGTLGRDNSFGHGRVNAYGAVLLAADPNNTPPVAVFQADPISGESPLTVNFDASGSSDAENEELTYTWDFGDGSVGTGQNTSHIYLDPGLFKPVLTVSDGIRIGQAAGEINVACPGGSILIELELILDDYPSEVSWELKNKDGSVIRSGGGYTGFLGSIRKEEFCLPAGCYDFVIRDSFGDGGGSYKLTQGGLVLASSNGQYGFGETKEICLDGVAPVIADCPTDITVSNDADSCEAAVTWTAPTASDDKGTVSLTSNFEPGAVFPVGTTEVTYTATDAAGNQATCSFTVTVEDTQDPIISCPANVSETVVFGVPGKIITYTTPTFSDNCTGAKMELTAGLASGTTFPLGETTVTYLATDAAGNTAECSFTVTITEDPDAVDPEISDCPTDITVSNDAGDCSAAVSWTAPTATDNSGSIDFVSNFEPGAVFPVGTTEVTYTATDAEGNQVTCSFKVTVEDTEDPIISCPANVSETVVFGETGKVITYATPTFSDNCTGASIELKSGLASGATFPIGATTVTYVATDAAGNTAECSFTVTITEDADAVDPIISNCPTDITVSNDPGDCSAAVTWTAPTATDNSGSVDLVSNFESGAVFPVGTTKVTYTATDAAGNQVTCSFDVTVADDELPVIGSVSDISVTVPSGQTVTSVSVPLPSVSDNCSATVTGVRSDGKPLTDPYPVGQTTITWSAEDPSGNDAAVVIQKVTVTQSAPSLAITSFTLINSRTDVDMFTLTNGMQINQNQVQGLNLNIRANTNPSVVGSVFITISGPLNRTITENVAPYALFGDTNGNYSGRSLPAGTYTVTARAFSMTKRRGTAGTVSTITFTILKNNLFRMANEEGNVENEVTEKERPTMEVMSEPSLKAFPNPVKDGRVSIVDSRFQEGMVKYVLYSINGAKLTEGQAEIGAGKTISLDFSGSAKQAGMYILILDYNNYLAPQRLQLIFE